MEVKHIHPIYGSESQRMDKQKETRAACLAALAKMRDKADKAGKSA